MSLVWLLVGRQGGSGSPGTCQHAQDMYIAVSSAYTSEQLNSVTISSDLAGKIFAEPSRGVFSEQERGFHVTSKYARVVMDSP